MKLLRRTVEAKNPFTRFAHQESEVSVMSGNLHVPTKYLQNSPISYFQQVSIQASSKFHIWPTKKIFQCLGYIFKNLWLGAHNDIVAHIFLSRVVGAFEWSSSICPSVLSPTLLALHFPSHPIICLFFFEVPAIPHPSSGIALYLAPINLTPIYVSFCSPTE